MENRSSSERKSTIIKTLIIAILLLLAFLSSVIYVYAYPKTTVTLYDDRASGYTVLNEFKVKKYSTLGELGPHEKLGHTFINWTYEDGSIFDPNRELDTDALNLYATYSRNSYTVTFHVQVYDEDGQFETYISNQPGYRTQEYLFGTTIQLPYGTIGNTAGGVLLPELTDRIGYHFVGWTTKVAEEEVMSENDVFNAGGNFVVPAGNVDLYAYWEKNEYEVVAYTGNSYEGLDKVTGNGTPVRDENGKFIIRNDRVEDVLTIKYLDSLNKLTSNYKPELTAEVDGSDYSEYVFKGWFLDEELTIPADENNYTLIIKLENDIEVPYLIYFDENDQEHRVSSVLSEQGKYQFHLYSKWERKSYTLSFNNNHSGSKGKLNSITVYKYDDHYGRHYNDVFSRDIEKTGYFNSIMLNDNSNVTTTEFLESNNGYRFIGWSTTPLATNENSQQYYRWTQNPISYDVNGNIIYTEPYYVENEYRHEVSEDITLYALWSRIRYVTFYEKSGTSRFNGESFTIEGIAGEWFPLPSSTYINSLGWSINDYTEFAGWRVGSGSTGTPILEKINDYPNSEYYWTFTSTSSTTTTICAYWQSKKYTIIYHYNDGSGKTTEIEALGGVQIIHPTNMVRENYIFDGWSKTQYPDNSLNKEIVSDKFKPTGTETTINYYATWTQKFTVEYDYGVGEGNEVIGTLPASVQYTKKNGDLNLSVKIGSGASLKRTGYTFKGWVLKNNPDTIFKTGNTVIFNFVKNAEDDKYYCYISGQASNLIEFQLDSAENYKVKLYALWEAKKYTITIHDPVGGISQRQEAFYGTDFVFTDYIVTNYEGYVLLGLSSTASGEILYSPETTMTLEGENIVGDLTFYVRYEIKNIYIEYWLKAEDTGNIEDTIFTPSIGFSGYGNAPVKYNAIITLPTPTISDANKKFIYWYYVDETSGDEIRVNSGEKLTYTGDKLVLFAKFEELVYNLEFRFINPLDNSDIVIINTIPTDDGETKIAIKKGAQIPQNVYEYITTELTGFIGARNIVQYSLISGSGLFNSYLGKTYEFVSGQYINIGSYPVIDSSTDIVFTTIWQANAVNFIYVSSDEPGAKEKTGFHTGFNYDDSDSIVLEDVDKMGFTYEDGKTVKRWYIVNSEGEKYYLEIGAYLISYKGPFVKVSDMKDYITWELNDTTDKFEGTIRIYAETQQVFTIEYYRYRAGALELISTQNQVYGSSSLTANLLSATDAIRDYGSNIIFNGWVIYSSNGRVSAMGENGLITDVTVDLDPTIFTDFKIKCYADFSYNVTYYYLIQTDGVFERATLRTDTHSLITSSTADYSNKNNYVTRHTIKGDLEEGFDIVEGYDYYGYLVRGLVYTEDYIKNTGITIDVDGNVIEVLAYLTRNISITYTISGDEEFDSDTYADARSFTVTYVLGYDDSVVAERVYSDDSTYTDRVISNITITNIGVSKEGYIFSGWQRKLGDVTEAYTYEPGAIVVLTEDANFEAVFTTPDAGTINGKIIYKDQSGNVLKEYDIKNGDTHIIINGTSTSYLSPSYAISGWTYTDKDGNITNYTAGQEFTIPLLIDNGQEFIFIAVLKEKYTIKFETYSLNTLSDIITFEDVENHLLEKPVLDNDYEFSYWELDFGGEEVAHINYNDIIVFKKYTEDNPIKYKKENLIEGNSIHTIPAYEERENTYILYAVAKTEILVTLNVTGVDEQGETKTITETVIVPFGTTYGSARLLVTEQMQTLETSARKIYAWTTDETKTDAGNYSSEELANLSNNITKIIKDVTLYAVWQSTYIVSYAEETDDFGYNTTPSNEYYFEGQTVEVNANVIKSIFYKNVNTVYFDNGKFIVYTVENSDVYQYVSGVVLIFSGNTQTVDFSKENTFTMPGSNVVISPISSPAYRVDFYQNIENTEDPIKTVYAKDLVDVKLDEHSTVRANFTFQGWNTDRNAETPLANLSRIEAGNTNLYAVWSSDYRVQFQIDGEFVFDLPLTRTSTISYDALYEKMTMANSAENGWFKYIQLNGNTRTYNYNNTYYYFKHFTYKNNPFDINSICEVTFTNNYIVNIILDNIYTIEYYASNGEETDPESLNVFDYVVKEGRIVEITEENPNGIGNLVLYTENKVSDYTISKGWQDTNQTPYDFGETVTLDKLNTLISSADDDRLIILTLAWDAKDFEFVLNFTETPYSLYSSVTSQEALIEKNGFTNVASTYLKDSEGNNTSGNIKFGDVFMIEFPGNSFEGYKLIGYSLTPYPLGFAGDEDTDDIIFAISSTYSDFIVLTENIINEYGQVVLYPVYSAIVTHSVTIVPTNGGFSYKLTVNDQIYDKNSYVYDLSGAVEDDTDFTVVNNGELTIYLTEYNILTIVGDSPENNYYSLESITTTIGTVDNKTVTILGTDVNNNNDECTSCIELVTIAYNVAEITINLSLVYSEEVANDTSTIILTAEGTTVTLSATQTTGSISLHASELLGISTSLSNSFKIGSIKSGDKVVSIVNNEIKPTNLIIENNVANLVITLVPKTFTVRLILQGGSITEPISYSHGVFGQGGILLEEGQTSFEIYEGATISIPEPTRSKYAFSYWTNNLNADRLDTISSYKVNETVTFTANYTSTVKTIYYFLADGSFEEVDFVSGAKINVGYNSSNELISDNTPNGYIHLGWIYNNTTYDDGDIFETEFKDYNFYQSVKGENVTVNFVYEVEDSEPINVYSMTVEYGTKFTLPSSDVFTTQPQTDGALYGYSISPKSVATRIELPKNKVVELVEDLEFDIDNGKSITLYTIYYQAYQYTFTYGVEGIVGANKTIVANQSSGEVNIQDLTYTLDVTTPPAINDGLSIFAGYNVTITINEVNYIVYDNNGTLVLKSTIETMDRWLVSAGETINLVNPAIYSFAKTYDYTFTPVYENVSGSTSFLLYITNPEDEEKTLDVTYSGAVGPQAYYTINVFLNNKFFVTSLPTFDYNTLGSTATWTIPSSLAEFTTENVNFIAHKVIGYTISYTLNEVTKTVELMLDDTTTGYNLAGGSNYVVKPIWEDRYSVTYYDDKGELQTSTYYDAGTKVVVDETVDKYSKDGYAFVGYTYQIFDYDNGQQLQSTNDFALLGAEIVMDKNYTFYPAFSKKYSVNFLTSDLTLEHALGNTNAITIDKRDTNLLVWLGQNSVDISDYFIVRYNDAGYSVAGFTVVPDKLANDLSEKDIFLSYTFEFDHLTGDVVNIYVAWQRAEYTVTFIMNANWNDGTAVDNTEYTVKYLHNQGVKFADDTTLQNKISAMPNNFQFKGYSIAESTKITSDTTIYVNFDIRFTIIYNLGDAVLIDTSIKLPTGEDAMYIEGATVSEYETSNIHYESKDNLFWTTEPDALASKTNFFNADGDHILTSADTAVANKYYEINLYLAGSIANYTVNLYVYKTAADLSNNRYSSTPYQLELAYGTELFVDDYEVDENGELTKVPSSPFDSLISNDLGSTLGVTTLYDLLFAFEYKGYTASQILLVNGNEVYIWDTITGEENSYFVQTYPSAEGTDPVGTLINNVYIVYELLDIEFEVFSVVADNDNIANNTSLSYEFTDNIATSFTIDDYIEFVPSRTPNSDYRYFSYATIESIILFEETNASAIDNIGYNFIGFYSALYDEDGNITRFIDLSQDTDNWDYTTANFEDADGNVVEKTVYKIRKSTTVYAVYTERPVNVVITYECSGIADYDPLKASILIDEKAVDEDRITSSTNENGQKVETIRALYGQDIKIENGSEMPFYINRFFVNGIAFDTDVLFTELVNDNEDLDEIYIRIQFGIETADVYVRTYLDNDYFIDTIQGTIVRINYIDYNNTPTNTEVTGIEIEDNYSYQEINGYGYYYNLSAALPLGSTITSIEVILNNYVLSGWIYEGEILSTTLNISVVKDEHLIAIFTPNTISVQFYTTQIQDEEGIVTNNPTVIPEYTITGIKYGDKIKLPYVVIEEEYYVSTGWTDGYNIYQWGENINAIMWENVELEDNILRIYADSIEKYYITFNGDIAGSLNITLPADFDTTYKNRNNLRVTEQNIIVSGTNTYDYVNANNLSNITINSMAVDEEGVAFASYIDIPKELLYLENLKFGGWKSANDTLYTDRYIFEIEHVLEENKDSNIVILTLADSGKTVIRFIVTDPTDETNQAIFMISNVADVNAEFNIDSVQMIYEQDIAISAFYEPTVNTAGNIVGWGNYFMKNTDPSILDRYEFHGWSSVRQNTIIPSIDYANLSKSSALVYDISVANGSLIRTTRDTSDKISDLKTLIDAGYIDFYSIWEEKKSIVFDASSEEYTNGFKSETYHAEGEIITLPNDRVGKNGSGYVDLINGTNKWTGWADITNNKTINFDDMTGGEYTYTVTSQNEYFTPTWTQGISVLFNTNFASWRTYFGNVMSASTGVSADTITSAIGYPYILADNKYTYTQASTVNVGNTEYALVFREGKFWQQNDTIEYFKYYSTFEDILSQQGIYSEYGTLDKYFDLLGWYIDVDGINGYDASIDKLIPTTSVDQDGQIIFELTSEYMALAKNGTLTLYAYWQPVNVSVDFYYSKQDAIDETNERYTTLVDEETGYQFIRIYVPFGYKLTIDKNYEDEANLVQYMYYGLAEDFQDNSNVINMTVNSNDINFYRFSHWSNYNGNDQDIMTNTESVNYNKNTISDAIIAPLRLYPVFSDQYVVEYRSIEGAILDEGLTQYIIIGEKIPVRQTLSTAVDIKIVQETYYLNGSANKVSLIDLDAQGKKTFVENLAFNDVDSFTITDEHYIIIYVDVNIIIRAYLPDYSGETPTIQQLSYSADNDDYKIVFNQTYDTKSAYVVGDGIRAKYNNATFAGWYYGTLDNTTYYSNESRNAFNLNAVETSTIELYNIGNTYYIVINGDMDNPSIIEPSEEGLVICIYAHFVISSTVEFASTVNNTFGTLSYNSSTNSSADSQLIIYDLVQSATSTSITYLTAYNSPYAPVITVNLKYGYTIKTISNINSDEFNTNVYSLDNTSYSFIDGLGRFQANLSKNTSSTEVNESIELNIVHTISLSHINQNLKFVIDIEYVTYNITYEYDPTTTAPLQYYNGSYYSFSTKGTVEFSDTANPLYVGSASTVTKFVVEYAITEVNETTNTLLLAGVPYGATIGIIANPVNIDENNNNVNGSMVWHFENWEIKFTDETITTDTGISIGEIGANQQLYKPSQIDNNILVKDYTLVAQMVHNTVNSITFELAFDRNMLDSTWIQLLDNASANGISFDSTKETNLWVITLQLDNELSLTNIEATSDITELLEQVQSLYNDKYNDNVATSTGSEISSIEVLLNYFWFSNSWNTYTKDANDNICYLETKDNKNIIYVGGDGQVTLYTKLTEAVLVDAGHQTLDYLSGEVLMNNGNKIYRGTIALGDIVLPDGTVSTNNNKDFFLMTDTDNSKVLKVQYGTELSITATPQSATDKNTQYTLRDWSLLGGNNVVTLYDNKTLTARLNTSAHTDAFVLESGSIRPEYKFYANIIIDTYDLVLYNNDGTEITRIEIAYDYNIDKLIYPNYQYTLDILRDGYRLPLFELDDMYINASASAKKDIITFKHSLDEGATTYGTYKYLFNYWKLSNENKQDKTAVLVTRDANTGIYSDVKLYAVYKENVAVDYTILSADFDNHNKQDIVSTWRYYLPETTDGSFFDQFGNEYTDDLYRYAPLYELNSNNSRFEFTYTEDFDRFGQNIIDQSATGELYIGSVALNAVGSAVADGGYTKVTTLRDIINTSGYAKINNAYRVYPAISYNVVRKYANASTSVLTQKFEVVSFGGAYYVSTTTDGYLVFTNVIDLLDTSSNSVNNKMFNFSSDTYYQFAFWQAENYSTGIIEYNIPVYSGNATDGYCCSEDKTYTTYYNVKFSVESTDQSHTGNVTVTNTSGTSVGLNNIAFSTNTPSGYFISDSGTDLGHENVTNRKIAFVKDGFNLNVIDRTSNITLYTIKYTTTEDAVKSVYFKVSSNYNNYQIYLDGEKNKEVIVENSWGSFTISPMVFFYDVNIEIADVDFVITNVKNTEVIKKYDNAIKLSTVSKTLSAGLPIETNGFESDDNNPWKTELFVRDIITEAIAGKISVTVSNTTVADSLKGYTTNYRWQYYYDNEWRDIKSGLTYLDKNGDSDSIQFRLACDWIEYTVQLSTLDIFTGTQFNSTVFEYDGSKFDISAALTSNNGNVTSTMTEDYGLSTNKTLKFTLLKGDTVTYDYETEKFVIVSDKYWSNGTTATIQASASGLYNQGWFKLNTNASGKYVLANMTKDFTIDYGTTDFASTYHYVLWLEPRVSTRVLVDRNVYDEYINGYGIIDIAVDDVKKSEEKNSNSGYSASVSQINNIYFNSLLVGASTKIWIRPHNNVTIDTNTGHQFINANYIPQTNENVTEDEEILATGTNNGWTYIVAGTISFKYKYIYVLYDANPSKSNLVVIDKNNNIQKQLNIYGGDNIAVNGTASFTVTNFFGVQTNYNFTANSNHTIYNILLNTTTDKLTMSGTTLTNTSLGTTAGSPFVLTSSNVGKNVIIKLEEYINTVEFNLLAEVQTLDNGTVEYLNWGATNELISTLNISGNVSVSTQSQKYNKLTISNLKRTDTLGLYYDINTNRLGMVLGVYNGNTLSTNTAFVRNYGGYNLLGIDIYEYTTSLSQGTSTKLVTGNYYIDGVDSYDKKLGDPSKLDSITSTKYTLVLRLQERDDVKLSFQMSLPYATDLVNLNMTSNLLSLKDKNSYLTKGDSYYAVQNYSKTFSVPGIVFNRLDQALLKKSGNTLIGTMSNGETLENKDANIEIGGNYKVRIKDGRLEVLDKNNNVYGYISYELPEFYSISGNTSGLGWYIVENNGVDVMTATSKTINGQTYKYWAKPTNAVAITSTATKINTDSTIYLALDRKAVNIYYETGTWWNSKSTGNGSNDPNYDINAMLKYDFMHAYSFESYGSIIRGLGGLVAAIPQDIGSTSVFTIASGYSVAKHVNTINENNNDLIRSGVHVFYKDTDMMTVVESALSTLSRNPNATISGSTLIKGSGFSYPAVAIVGGMSTGSKNTTYDVLLKDSTTWFFAGIPAGDSGVNNSPYTEVTIYNMPIENVINQTNNKVGTYNFIKTSNSLTLIQSIIGMNYSSTQKSKPSFQVYISKSVGARLYDGFYYGDIKPTSSAYSQINMSFTCTDSVWNTVKANTSKRAVLSGFTIVDSTGKKYTYKHKTGSTYIFNNGKYDIAMSTFTGNISIYPIWEALEVYHVQISDNKNVLTALNEYVLEGQSVTYSHSVTSSYMYTSMSATSIPSSANRYTVTSGNYIFSGLTTSSSRAAYSNSATNIPADYTKYGLLRVKNDNGTYTVDQNGSHISNNKYTFTITPTDDMTLYTIWLQKGYEITYKFNGSITQQNTSGSIKSTFKTTKSAWQEKISYAYNIQGMPIKVGYNFSVSNMNDWSSFYSTTQYNYHDDYDSYKKYIYPDQAFSIRTYYKGTNGTTSLSAGGLYQYSDITNGTINFSLNHISSHTTNSNKSPLYRNSSLTTTYGCSSGNHTKTTYWYWSCYYCDYHTTTESENKTNPTTGSIKSKDATYHHTEVKCGYCNKVTGYKNQQKHSVSGYTYKTLKAATCTVDGKEQLTCKACGQKSEQTIKAPGSHNWVRTFKGYKNNDCTQGKNYEKKCSRCNTIQNVVEAGNATHSFGKTYYDNTSLACTNDKARYQTCSRCNKSGNYSKRPHNLDGNTIKFVTNFYVAQPDPWHCSGNYAYLVVGCSYSKCTYYEDKYKTRVRMSMYNISNNDILLTSSVYHKKSGIFSSKCSNSSCKQTLYKDNDGDYVTIDYYGSTSGYYFYYNVQVCVNSISGNTYFVDIYRVDYYKQGGNFYKGGKYPPGIDNQTEFINLAYALRDKLQASLNKYIRIEHVL